MRFIKSFNIKLLLPLLLFVALASLRFINLSADPVPLTWLHNQDEGNYSYNTRNLVLARRLVTDEVNFFFVSPLWTLLQYPFVKIGGVWFESFRLPAALSSVLLAAALALFALKTLKSRLLAFLGGLLVLVNFLILVHSRIAMPENTNILFLTLAFVSWYSTLKKYPQISTKWSVATGTFWTLAFLTKGNGVSLGITLVLSGALLVLSRRHLPTIKEVTKLLLPFLIFGFVFVSTRFVFTKLYPREFGIATIELTEKYRPLIRTQILNPLFWRDEGLEFLRGGEATIWIYVPFLTLGALIFSGLTTLKIIKKKRLPWLQIEAFCFLVGNLFWFLLVVYKPARYFLLVLPALIIANLLLVAIKPKLGLILVFLTLIFDFGLGIKFIYSNYTFDDEAVGKTISAVVGNKKVAGGGLDSWTLDATYPFLNTYFPGWDEASLLRYFNQYGYPDFFLFVGLDDIRLAKTSEAPVLKSKLTLVKVTETYNRFRRIPPRTLIYAVEH